MCSVLFTVYGILPGFFPLRYKHVLRSFAVYLYRQITDTRDSRLYKYYRPDYSPVRAGGRESAVAGRGEVGARGAKYSCKIPITYGFTRDYSPCPSRDVRCTRTLFRLYKNSIDHTL